MQIFSLLYLYFIVWPYEEGVGWWRTALVYILSGTGGILLSGLLTPYQPMVSTFVNTFWMSYLLRMLNVQNCNWIHKLELHVVRFKSFLILGEVLNLNSD